MISLLTWDRVAPWKILSLPRPASKKFAPAGYGSASSAFASISRQHGTIWVVTKPKHSDLPPTLVAKIHATQSYTVNSPDRTKELDDLLEQWQNVTVADSRSSRFYELNDASNALAELGITMQELGLHKHRLVPAEDATTAFRSCTSNKPTVFISFTHAQGAPFAFRLAIELLQHGFRPWFDALAIPRFDLEGGRHRDVVRLRQLIQLGIDHADLAIVVKTKDFGHTRWTRFERKWIRERRRDDPTFRCIQIVYGGKPLHDFDVTLDPQRALLLGTVDLAKQTLYGVRVAQRTR